MWKNMILFSCFWGNSHKNSELPKLQQFFAAKQFIQFYFQTYKQFKIEFLPMKIHFQSGCKCMGSDNLNLTFFGCIKQRNMCKIVFIVFHQTYWRSN